MKKTVLFLCGGKSGEHEISLISALNILRALDTAKFDFLVAAISKQGEWFLSRDLDFTTGGESADSIKLKTSLSPLDLRLYSSQSQKGELLEGGKAIAFDVVFPILHGPFGEDGRLQGLLDMIGVTYVGSGCGPSSNIMDKQITKVLLQNAGVAVAPGICVRPHEDVKSKLSEVKDWGTWFVKPSRMGSSVGISKVHDWAQLEQAVEYARQFDKKVLIEKAIVGRELEVAVREHKGQIETSLAGEIVPSKKAGFYSYEAKYLNDGETFTQVPADIPSAAMERIRKLAQRAFEVLECEGLARIDFFLEEKSGQLILNEVNSMPGFTPISMFPQMFGAMGVNYGQLITDLIDECLKKR